MQLLLLHINRYYQYACYTIVRVQIINILLLMCFFFSFFLMSLNLLMIKLVIKLDKCWTRQPQNICHMDLNELCATITWWNSKQVYPAVAVGHIETNWSGCWTCLTMNYYYKKSKTTQNHQSSLCNGLVSSIKTSVDDTLWKGLLMRRLANKSL